MYAFIIGFFMFFVYAQDYYGDLVENLYIQRRFANKKPNYNETFFPSLENYQVNAKLVKEDDFPWIARLVHSTSKDVPYLCTASCIEPRIFITAARCIFSLKVAYTTIINQNHHFPALAFVVSSNETKQGFDEIGFIVVDDKKFKGQWATVELFDITNRTDLTFEWFAALGLPKETSQHIVVGYAMNKAFHKDKIVHRQYDLTILDVFVDINICPEILISNKKITGFHVPCYHSCSINQFRHKDPKCSNYHGVEGSVVLNVNTNKVLGISTWGAYFINYELPVGFSVPNSEIFFIDYACARRIKQYKGILVGKGYYQLLCEEVNKTIE